LRGISRDIVWEWDFPSTPIELGIQSIDPGTRAAGNSFNQWLQQVHPKDRLKVLASLKSALEQGRPEWAHEYRKLVPGKGFTHVSDHAFIIRDNAWNPVRVVGRSADVSQANWASQGLHGEWPYRTLFESNPHATLLADNGFRIVAANEAACDVLGYSRDKLTKLALEDILRGSTRKMLLELTPEEPSPITFEEDCVRASGEVFRAKINASVVSGMEEQSVDRIITIEEMADEEGNP
jgi:PAS domain S-box-containing protein